MPRPSARTVSHARWLLSQADNQLLDSMSHQRLALEQAQALLPEPGPHGEVGALIHACHASQSAQASEKGLAQLHEVLSRICADLGRMPCPATLRDALEALADALDDEAPLGDGEAGHPARWMVRHAAQMAQQLQQLLQVHMRLIQRAGDTVEQAHRRMRETSLAVQQLNVLLNQDQDQDQARRQDEAQLRLLLEQLQLHSARQEELLRQARSLQDALHTESPPG